MVSFFLGFWQDAAAEEAKQKADEVQLKRVARDQDGDIHGCEPTLKPPDSKSLGQWTDFSSGI